jgi:hypothetical protein
MELPLQYDTVDTTGTLTLNSELDFFAMADRNLISGYNHDNNLSTDLNIDRDYHSSDHIFDHFTATFGSLDSA